MKPIKCEVHEPCIGCVKITYHKSIRKAMKYCKTNGLSYNCILPQDYRHIWLFGQPSKGHSYNKTNAYMVFKGELL